MDNLTLQLCDIQGRLFELSVKKGYGSEDFVLAYMKSNVAVQFEQAYNRMQWAGEEYMLEDLLAECNGLPMGETYTLDEMFWTGYTYRYWHFLTAEKSKDIVKIAPPATMRANYAGFHTMDVSMAIDDLKELHRLKKNG